MNVTSRFIRFIMLLMLSSTLCLACQQKARPGDSQPDPDSEERFVFADLLDSRFIGQQTKQVLIVDQTRVHSVSLMENDLEQFQKTTPLSSEMIDSFKVRNQQPYPIDQIPEGRLVYQLISQEQVDELQPQDKASGWKLFDEKYPNTVGFIYLSRVGFNTDFSQALVYYEWYHYEQPVSGGYFLLEYQDGQWVVESGYEWMT